MPPWGNRHERTALEHCACRTVSSPAGDRAAVIGSGAGITLWDGRLRPPLGLLSGGLSKGCRAYRRRPPPWPSRPMAPSSPRPGRTGTVRRWDVASQQPLGTALPGAGDAGPVAHVRRGRPHPARGGARVPAQTYDIDPARAVTEVCRRAVGTLSPVEWRTYLPGIPYRRCAERRPKDRPACPAARRAGRRPRRRRGGPAQNASRPGDKGVVRGHARLPRGRPVPCRQVRQAPGAGWGG